MSTALKSSSLHVHRFVRDQVGSALRPGGFSFDAARGLWTRSLSGGIEHFVALPTDVAGNHGPVVVTANLGVHFRPLAARLVERNDRRRAQNLSTFTRNVGQLSAKRVWRDWVIRDAAEAERVARRLAARIVSVGLPWLARFDSLAAVCAGFRTFGREDHREHAVPMMERMMAEYAGMGGRAALDGSSADGGSASVGVNGDQRVFSIRFDRDDPVVWRCDD